MKICLLCDNKTIIDSYYLGEPAFSLYIEEGGKKILFDTGYSDVFLKNAEKMGIDLKSLDCLVFSHGHNDHTGGLKYLLPYLKDAILVAHPDCFEEKWDEGLPVGSPLSIEEIGEHVKELRLTKEVCPLTEKLFYLGEIPRIHGFEDNTVGFRIIDGEKEPDRCLDDSALAYDGEDGLVIISGCAHSGIVNIVDQACRITGKTHIQALLGGFHLLKEDERSIETVKHLKDRDIDVCYPCHCVSFISMYRMREAGMDVRETGVGMKLEWR